ncbi:MAG: hypothetical protein OIN66_18755 [Candidatus Methanoperedens sp.]|nr:hypothetical protein [Candidatus Methanoperedens sp.]
MANLKPFNGFTDQAILVMEKLNSLDEISGFLNSVKDLMENDKEISMVEKTTTHREHNGHEYTSSIWPAYIEKDSDGAIYYGTWFRFDGKKFSVYVEFEDWAAKAHQRWKEKNLSRWEAIKSEVGKKWSKQEVFLEYEEDEGYYLTVSVKHNFLKNAGLLDFVKDGVISLRDDIVKPMGLKKRE